MRVLFVPYFANVFSHQIPLLALNKITAGAAIETAFLLPRKSHGVVRGLGVEVLDIDNDGMLHTELKAYKSFRPNVVVDDTSFTTGWATKITRLPRIAIQRTGLFPGDGPRITGHIHSIPFHTFNLSVSDLGLAQPKGVTDIFSAPLKIVPGIKSIEQLPKSVANDPSYYFSGPLLMEDYLVGELNRSGSDNADKVDPGDFRNIELLKAFIDSQRQRKIIYLTFGLVAIPNEPVFDCIRYLLSNDIAVITNVAVTGLTARQQELYYHAYYLPMHYVCSKSDLMAHHCGSATYHYPLIHNVPSITIGTKRYDRDNVAIRLQELGASIYLPAPDEVNNFVDLFKNAVLRYFDDSGAFMRDARERIRVLKSEIEQTSSSFDFIEMLRKATQLTEK
jgi:hypothetical protein